jgi:amino acid transporter
MASKTALDGKKHLHDVGDDPAHDFGNTEELVSGLHRKLSNRQIQWIAIGGSIGTALFVSIAWGLVEGGPGSLFIAFAIYCMILALANSCMAEMTVFMPVVGGWVRMGSKWVDEAYGFMAGWNFFVRSLLLERKLLM